MRKKMQNNKKKSSIHPSQQTLLNSVSDGLFDAFNTTTTIKNNKNINYHKMKYNKVQKQREAKQLQEQ